MKIKVTKNQPNGMKEVGEWEEFDRKFIDRGNAYEIEMDAQPIKDWIKENFLPKDTVIQKLENELMLLVDRYHSLHPSVLKSEILKLLKSL